MKIRRAATALIAVVVAATIGLAGCAGYGGSQGGTSNVLRVVGQNEPVSINPVYSSTSDVKSWGPMYDALVGTDRASTEPNQDGLLHDWSRPTPTTWLFKVREGVTFHNGEAFDAAAAAFTINQEVNDPKAILGGNFRPVESAAPQGADLLVTTHVPYPALPSMLAITMAVAPGAYQAAGGDAFAQNPVGTGPFKFDSYTRGGALRMVANPDYWRGPPELGGVTVSWSTEPQARASLVQTGQADLALDLTPQSVAGLRSVPDLQVVEQPIDARYFLYFNMHTAPFDNPDLRRAAAMAIDKNAIVSGIFRDGGAEVYDYFVGDQFAQPPTYPDAVGYAPDQARDLLASVPGDHQVTLTYASGRSPQDTQIGTAVAGMLTQVGFQVTNEPLDFATFNQRRISGDVQVGGVQNINAFRDPDEQFRPWVLTGGSTNNCIQQPYDELSAQALAQDDRAAREAFYAQAEDRLLNQDICYVPILRYDGVWAMTSKVGGFVAPRVASPDYYEMSLGG